jgi:hypothetical protein
MIQEFSQSDDAHFETIMRALVAEVPSISFFIATDDEATEAKFRALFGGRVIVQRKSRSSRATPPGMAEALVDLLLLGRTAAVLGNHWSSFSYVGSALGGKPLVIANEQTAHLELDVTVRRFVSALERATVQSHRTV